MKKLTTIFVATIIIYTIFSKNLIYSNGATYGGSGETIFPLKENGIRMVREEVIAFENNQSIIKCLFILANLENTERNIQIGFPFDEGYENMFADKNDHEMNLKVFVNDEKVIVNKKKGIDNPEFKLKEKYPVVFAFNVHFEPYEEKNIRIEYVRDWSEMDAEDGIGDARMDFGYIVETGALWAGNIEKADFYINISQANDFIENSDTGFYSLHIEPNGYKIKNNVIEWHFKNWKPSKNISIWIEHSNSQ